MNFFNEFSSQEKQDYLRLETEEAKRLFVQIKIKHSFRLLVYLLGYKDIGQFHKTEIANIGKVRKIDLFRTLRRLWLWARGHFKTSLVTVAHSIFLIVNNVNIRLLLVSNTLDVSKKILKEIKDHFTNNEDFRYFFREYCPIPNKEGKVEFGTTENFTIPNRTKVLKEPTIMVAGVGTNLTGLHFDWMKIDDLVTRDSVSNDTQIQASKDYYASLRQLFDKPTEPKEDVTGTTYHFNDLYSELLKNSDFIKSIIPLTRDATALFTTKNMIFGERFTPEGAKAILNDPNVGPYEFYSQYLLNPRNPKDAKLKDEWLVYYDSLPKGLAEYICVDPASTQKKKSDYTVIERWGIDYLGKHHLIEGIRDKLTVFQRLDKIVEFAKRCKRLLEVKYEVLGGRHGDLENLQLRFIKEKIPIIPHETKSTNASKIDRIEQRLAGQYFTGNILLPRNLPYKSTFDGKVHDFVAELKLEYLQFPFSEHDDILDCQSQMFEEQQNLSKGLKIDEKEKRAWGTADDWDRFYAEIDRLQRENPFLSRNQAFERYRKNSINQILMRKQ